MGKKLQLPSTFTPRREPNSESPGSIERSPNAETAAVEPNEKGRTEQALQISDAKFNETQRTARLGTWEWDFATGTTVWSEEMYRLLGADPAQPPVPYLERARFFTPESWKRLESEVARCSQTGDPYELELEIVRIDGSHGWVLARGQPELGRHGDIVRVHGALLDITQRKEAEIKFRQSEERLKLALDVSRTGIFEVDLKTGKGVWAAEVDKIWDLPHDFSGSLVHYCWEHTHKADIARVRDRFSRLVASGEVGEMEFRIVRANGDERWIRWRGKVMHDPDGGIRVVGVNIDITENKQAEDALLRSEARYRSLVTATAQIVWTAAPSGEIVTDTASWRFFTGMTWEQYRGQGWIDAVHPDDRSAVIKTWKRALREKSFYEAEYRLRRWDGEFRTVAARGVHVLESDGSIREWIGTCTDITESKQAQAALIESETRFRTLFENAGEAIYLLKDGVFVVCNKVGLQLFSGPGQPIIGQSPSDISPPTQPDGRDSKAVAVENMNLALNCNEPIRFDWVCYRGDGTPVETEVTLSRLSIGGELHVLGVTRDISQRKRDEEALRVLNAQLECRVEERTAELLQEKVFSEHLINSLPGIFYLNSEEGDLLQWNQNLEVVSGYSAQELRSKKLLDFIAEDQRELVVREMKELFEKGAADLEADLCLKDGKRTPYLFTGIRIDLGQERGLLGFGFDIRDRKKIENALRESNARLRATFSNVTEAIWVADLNGLLIDFNEEFLRFHRIHEPVERGQPLTDVTKYFDVWFPDGTHASLDQRSQARALRGESATNVEYRLRSTVTGETWWGSYNFGPIKDEQGNIIGAVVSGRDVTGLKKIEDALRESENHFRNLANSVPDLVWTCIPDGKCDYLNSRWFEYTGIPEAELVGDAWIEQVYLDDRERLATQWREFMKQDRPFDVEFRLRSKDGRYRWFKARAQAAHDDNGRIVKWYGTNSDIEILKQAQEKANAANRELESFNYAIAHDLRAPLRHIHGYSEFLAVEATPVLSDVAREHLRGICEGIEHMGHLLQELLNLSRLARQDFSRRTCDMNVLVRQAIAVLKPETKDRFIEWRIAELPVADCDEALTLQVLVNLLSNAIKFTRRRNPAVIEIDYFRRNQTPVFCVRDNGEGFDMGYAEKLFGVFQRLHSREEFEGTGVGLAIVQRIIQKHGGLVWGQGEEGRGANFYFSLEPVSASSLPTVFEPVREKV